ncbi:MAG: DHHA1 domain-containing protein [Coriobacteriales bacterium]|nr:DHHA1 domain-containing protein [Coriobacteriales bacterium]
MQITDLKTIAQQLKESKSVAICGHLNPDGDCIGSSLAMCLALLKLGIKAIPFIQSENALEPFAFLKGSTNFIEYKKCNDKFDTLLICDVAQQSRVGISLERFQKNSNKCIVVDHHPVDCDIDCLYYGDSSAAATCMIVWDLIELIGVNRDKDIACACYCGVLTDTGRFQYQNASSRALLYASQMLEHGAVADEIAKAVYQRKSIKEFKLESIAISRLKIFANNKCAVSYLNINDYADVGASPDINDSIIDYLRDLADMEVIVLIRQRQNSVRCSIRSKGDFNVAAIAESFGGGGHKAAAGFTIYDTVENARKIVIETLEKYFV